MSSTGSLATIAALIGDPARAAMLIALMDGRALTAGELARAAGVTPPTASSHLGRLLESGLLELHQQGRHRYYRISGEPVAQLIESMMAVGGELRRAAPPRAVHTGPRDEALRRARLCYNHLAGEIAVRVADAMIARGHLEFGPDGGVLTREGLHFLRTLGIDLSERSRSAESGSSFCRPCLDWSERRPHLGGRAGRELFATFVQKGWLRQERAGRAITVTPAGLSGLWTTFGIDPA